MNADSIAEVRIDASGRLCILPKTNSFPFIYRAGMEVYWDNDGKYLYSPSPREWTYIRWFQQIIAAVEGEYGCVLAITPDTRWHNVEDTPKALITSSSGPAANA